VNPPNLLTFSRVPILFAIAGLLFAPFPGARVLALLCFVAGGLTDWLDGYYARKLGIVSDFGKLMDALADKVFIVGLFTTFLVAGQAGPDSSQLLPAWALPLLLLILAREFLITGLRLVAASSGIVLSAEKSGKQKTVAQIMAAGLLLAAEAASVDFPGWPGWIPATFYWAGLAFFVFASGLTVGSGTLYLVKYWGVFIGRDDRGGKA